MADVYTPPPDLSYLLVTPFSMPSDRGDRWAVSFTGNNATLLAAALSVIITVSIFCLWNLICFVAMFFDGNATRRRYVALVTLWNSNDPWFAFKELLSYTFQCAPKSGAPESDFLYGLTFCIIALAVFGGSIAMGVIGPSLVQIGNVAPVRPTSLFYPETPAQDDPVQQLQDFGLRAPAVMRALGSVEAAKVTLRSRVLVEETNYPNRENGDRVIGLTYSYSLSGVDLGLQGGTDLALVVEGSCITEYGWWFESPEEDEMDLYHLWKNANQSAWVLLNFYDTQHAPQASFYLHSQAEDQIFRDSNVSYAVTVSSAHRSSISQGSDPWYATEDRDQPDERFNARFWMKSQRPILSCWEQDKWSYGTQSVSSVFELKNIPGMKIPKVLLEVLETTFGGGPMIVRLGNASGDSALRSRTTSPNGVIDAQASSIHDDMERLILGSFVASRNLFSDATMFGQSERYGNVFTGPNGQPADGAGNFVVSSPDIQTFSLTGIVTLAAILAALILANCVLWLLVHGNSSSAQNKWTRFHVLTAVQLFRCVYESDADTSDQWSCGMLLPTKSGKNSFRLAACPEKKNKNKCKGHINKDPNASTDGTAGLTTTLNTTPIP